MAKSLVKVVLPGSIAHEAGIESGDMLLSINGEKIEDVFDYRFLSTEENLVLEIQKKDGELWELEVEKDEYEDLGIDFESAMMDDAKSCSNQCVFCFIDQLPKGMRHTLYFKDDDSRLSFLMGNYVTLTNLRDDDIRRIIRYRMSPINVSVHATDPSLRVSMLNNRFAGDVLDKIRRLTGAGITVNCQIVLCREINDGEELDRTIRELAGLYPGMNSISVVPVGITRYREGLANLKPFDAEASMQVVRQVEKWQELLSQEHHSRVVYLADEFYIMAGLDIPEYVYYEDFPQIENGVGLIAMLRQEFSDCLKKTGKKGMSNFKERKISLATGVSSSRYIREMVQELEKCFKGLTVEVYEIKNTFFGENVTVTGLLTGQDIIEQLKGRELGSELLLCRCMLKAGEDVFLDDVTVGVVEKVLGIKIVMVENSGKDLIKKVLGRHTNKADGKTKMNKVL